MVSALFVSPLVRGALVWLCLMHHVTWPSDTAACPRPLEPPSAKAPPRAETLGGSSPASHIV